MSRLRGPEGSAGSQEGVQGGRAPYYSEHGGARSQRYQAQLQRGPQSVGPAAANAPAERFTQRSLVGPAGSTGSASLSAPSGSGHMNGAEQQYGTQAEAEPGTISSILPGPAESRSSNANSSYTLSGTNSTRAYAADESQEIGGTSSSDTATDGQGGGSGMSQPHDPTAAAGGGGLHGNASSASSSSAADATSGASASFLPPPTRLLRQPSDPDAAPDEVLGSEGGQGGISTAHPDSAGGLRHLNHGAVGARQPFGGVDPLALGTSSAHDVDGLGHAGDGDVALGSYGGMAGLGTLGHGSGVSVTRITSIFDAARMNSHGKVEAVEDTEAFFWVDMCCSHQKHGLTSEAMDFDAELVAIRPDAPVQPAQGSLALQADAAEIGASGGGDGEAKEDGRRRRLVLERCIAACVGGTVIWWQPWDTPGALTQVRHLWELHVTTEFGHQLHLAIPTSELKSMKESDGFKLRLLLEQLRSLEARATCEVDWNSLHELIEERIGRLACFPLFLISLPCSLYFVLSAALLLSSPRRSHFFPSLSPSFALITSLRTLRTQTLPLCRSPRSLHLPSGQR